MAILVGNLAISGGGLAILDADLATLAGNLAIVGANLAIVSLGVFFCYRRPEDDRTNNNKSSRRARVDTNPAYRPEAAPPLSTTSRQMPRNLLAQALATLWAFLVLNTLWTLSL